LSNKTKHIAIFASGKGSNAQSIISHFANSEYAKVALIVTNNSKAGVINIANSYGIPLLIISNTDLLQPEKLLQHLQYFKINLIVLAGFLKKIPDVLVHHYPNKIINIHPALLPKFGGKGMYGNKVHEAVLNAHEQVSGITIHYVNEHYDEGQIIFQAETPIANNETVETLRNKIQALEHMHYAAVIEQLLKNQKP
jgi:phosphoribosylglycinamide formyltransferase-1